tara:strand:- start:2924 stop:3811 length:888 start_codon:yes stop_codon:yes gene_type:complete
MKQLLVVSLFTFALVVGNVVANEVVSDKRISEISQRLEGYSTESLIERRDFLISYQEGNASEDENGVPAGSSSERALEISIIEALLLALGVVMLDNVSEDSTTPPDTVFPVITILGDNPATVELGSAYNDAGATSDGGETVSSSGSVDTNTVGTYTITYSATDTAGNTSTATRTVNVVDTTAPVITSSDTFVADENQTAIGTVTATDLQTVTFTVSGSEIQVTSGGVLTFVTAPDYETKSVYTATVTATDASSNSSTQDITVNVNDVGGIDDDPGTGTGTSTSSTGTGSGTGTGA